MEIPLVCGFKREGVKRTGGPCFFEEEHRSRLPLRARWRVVSRVFFGVGSPCFP